MSLNTKPIIKKKKNEMINGLEEKDLRLTETVDKLSTWLKDRNNIPGKITFSYMV